MHRNVCGYVALSDLAPVWTLSAFFQTMPARSERWLLDLSQPIYAGISGKNSWGFMKLA